MSLGVCCQYLEPVTKKSGKIDLINKTNEKNLQFNQFKNNKYSNDYIKNTWLNNLSGLFEIIKLLHSQNVKVFRVSSNLLPLFDLVDESIRFDKDIETNLSNIGKFVLENKIRLTQHPSQFCVISSNKEQVIENSIKLLDYHAFVFDKMGLPESAFYAINIHGGVKGNHKELITSLNKLNSNVKSRLTLENDELAYSTKELHFLNKETGIPIVFDSHHHSFNGADLSVEDALELAKSTWKGIKPLTHLSNTEPGFEKGSFQNKRKHSGDVYYIPECQKKDNNNNVIDIEMEFKNKNIAVFKAVNELQLLL